jgi:hypothetical protein
MESKKCPVCENELYLDEYDLSSSGCWTCDECGFKASPSAMDFLMEHIRPPFLLIKTPPDYTQRDIEMIQEIIKVPSALETLIHNPEIEITRIPKPMDIKIAGKDDPLRCLHCGNDEFYEDPDFAKFAVKCKACGKNSGIVTRVVKNDHGTLRLHVYWSK